MFEIWNITLTMAILHFEVLKYNQNGLSFLPSLLILGMLFVTLVLPSSN